MSDLHENSFRYIMDFLKWLVSDANIQRLPEFTFRIDMCGELTDVRFERSEMDDFEIALEKYQNTNYFHMLENRIKYRFYVALGIKGLIPYLQISNELLREKGEWLQDLLSDVAFDANFCRTLYQGLTLLSASIEEILASDLRLPEVEVEKCIVDNLKRFYEEKGHLNSQGAEMESLSYLKAAAVCVIMEKEKARSDARIPRLRKAIDADIYAIVSKIRNDPFINIKLPEAMHDYVIHQEAPNNAQKIQKYKREIVPNAEQDKLDGLLDLLDQRLSRRRKGAWAALDSDNPDRLSQAANSMVELLDQVIGQVCKDTDLATYLTTKYQTHQKTGWVDATKKWIGKTKDNLHSTKHHVDHQSEQLTKRLLFSAESIILVLLE